MIQFRRFSALLLGVWLGASILSDLAVTQNFQTVDRFLDSPGNEPTAKQIAVIGRAPARVLLRRNAGEENNWIFSNWELTELGLGALLLLTLLGGRGSNKLVLGLCAGMIAIVAAEHFLLTPQIVDLGRRIDDLPPNDPAVSKFWTLHGFYSGLDILKLLVAAFLGWSLVNQREPLSTE